MKARLFLLIAALGFSVAAVAQQDTAQAPDEATTAPEAATPKFVDVDTNEDGKIDQKEAVVLAAAFEQAEKEFKFEMADKNEDGAIDAAEFAALMS